MVYHICRIFVFCSQALMNATLRRFCCEGGLTAKCSQQTKSRGQVFDPGLNQRPVPLILFMFKRGLIGGPFSFSRDKILPSSLLLSFRSHPVATTQRRFRLNFWNLGRIAVPLPSQTSCNGE